MSLREEYRATLKCLDVEEAIDLALHRPLAFGVAKLAARASMTPNQLTALSLLLGVAGGATLIVSSLQARLIAATLLFLSQVLDCSDGMLARMRKSASELGRMLDGSADGVTAFAALLGSVYVMVERYPRPIYVPLLIVALTGLAARTSLMHTILYDHYKNLYVRLTVPGVTDAEDLEVARARHAQTKTQPQGLVLRGAWRLYLDYLSGQRRTLRWFDPYSATRMKGLPVWSEAVAQTYRRHALGPLKVWRSAFGVGSLIFGFAVFNAFGRPDLFLLFRLVPMNLVFFLYLMPAQRRASREAFRELGLLAQPAAEAAAPIDQAWAPPAREKHA